MIKQMFKVYEASYIEFDTEQPDNTKTAARQKTSLLKETVENAGFYRSVLNKIMITEDNA